MEFYVRAILSDHFSKVLIVVVEVRGRVQSASTLYYELVLRYGPRAIWVEDGTYLL